MRLIDFFENVYLPEAHAEARHNHVLHLRHVLRKFLECFGSEIACESVTPTMLDEFERLRIEAGNAKSAARYRSNMVAIMVHYASHRFTQKPGGSMVNYKAGRRGQGRIATEHALEPGTLWHLFKTSYRPKKLRNGSTNTEKQYRVQLTHFAKFLGHEPTLADLNEDIVSAFLEQHSIGRSAPTTNKAYWCLMALWRFAAKKRLVAEFPTIPAMREPERVPQAWMIDELVRLLASCRREQGKIQGIPAADWWFALHMFCWTTGERVGAALAVRLVDVNFDRGEVLIPAEVRKGKTKDMLYRLRPDAREAINRIRWPYRELLFPFGGLHRGTFYNHYKRILKRAGLPTGRKHAPQKLRRTFASYVEAGGGNATVALAHSNRSIAVKSYLDPRICSGRNPADLLPPVELPREEDAA